MKFLRCLPVDRAMFGCTVFGPESIGAAPAAEASGTPGGKMHRADVQVMRAVDHLAEDRGD